MTESGENVTDDAVEATEISSYRGALERAWADGIITGDEEAMLQGLREALGITPSQHQLLENQVKAERLIALINTDMMKDATGDVSAEGAAAAGVAQEELDRLSEGFEGISLANATGVTTDEAEHAFSEASRAINAGDVDTFRTSLDMGHSLLKRARESRKFQERLVKARMIISSAQKLGVDVDKAGKLLEAAVMAAEKEDTGIALRYLKGAREEANAGKKRLWTFLQVKRLQRRIDMEGFKGVMLLESQEAIKRVRDTVESDGDVNIRELVSEAERVIEANSELSSMRGEMDRLKGRIEDLAGLGVNTDNISAGLLELQEYWLQDDVEGARTNTDRLILEVAEAQERFLARDALAGAEAVAASCQEVGAFTTELESQLVQSRDALEARDYQRCRMLALKTQKEGEVGRVRAGRRRSKECIVNIRELMDATDLPPEKMNELTERVATAQSEMDDGDFDGCMETIRSVATEFQAESDGMRQDEDRETASTMIAGLEKLIAAADGLNVDTSRTKTSLEDARSRFGRGDYRRTGDVVMAARYDLARPRSHMLGTVVGASHREALKTLEMAEEEGADVREAREMLFEAELEMFASEGGAVKSEAMLDLVSENTSRARRKRLSDLTGRRIQTIHQSIEQAREQGLEMNEAESMLNRAEALFLEQDDLDSSMRLAETAMEMVEDSGKRQSAEVARAVMEEAVTAIDETRAAGGELEDAARLLAVAEAQFAEDDFEAVEHFASQAIDIAETQRVQVETKTVRGDLEEMKERLDGMENEGMQVGTAVDMLAEAESLFDGGDISGAKEAVERAGAKAASTRTVFEGQMAQSALLSARSSLLDAKEVHADVAGLQEKYQYAKSLADDGKFREAESAAMELEQSAVEIRLEAENAGTEKIATEAIERARTRLGEAMTAGLESDEEARIMGLISQAESALEEDGDADEAILIAEEAGILSEKFVLKGAGAQMDTFETLEALLSGMAQYGVQVDEAQGLLNKVREARESGDLTSAQETMKELGGMLMGGGPPGGPGVEAGLGTPGGSGAGLMSRDQQEVAGRLGEVRFASEELKRLSGDTADIRDALSDAESALMEGDPDRARSILEDTGGDIQKRLEDVYRVRAQEALKTVRTLVEKRNADGTASESIEAGLSEMLDIYKNGGLEGLRTLRSKADEMERQEKSEREAIMQEELTRRMNQLASRASEVRAQGGTIIEVDNLLQLANEARSKGETAEARNLVNRAGQEVDEVWLLMRRTDILVELESTRWMFLKLKKAGASAAPMGSAIVAATKALERGELEKAASFSNRARTIMNSTTGPWMEQLVLANIHELKGTAARLAASGVDTGALTAQVGRAEALLGSGDISGAMAETVTGYSIVHRFELDASTSSLHQNVSQLKARILSLADSGLDMKVPLTLQAELVQALRKGKVDEVNRGLENLDRLVNNIQAGFSRERAKETIDTVQKLIEYLHRQVPTSTMMTANGEVILKNASKMMDKGSFEFAERYATRAREFILDIPDEQISGVALGFLYARTEEDIDELDKLIDYLRSHNITQDEVSVVEEYLGQARLLQKDRKNVLEAEKVLLKGKAAALRLKNDYLRNKVVKALNRFTALVEQGRKAGKDTSRVEAGCRKARELMKRLDFESALAQLERLAGK